VFSVQFQVIKRFQRGKVPQPTIEQLCSLVFINGDLHIGLWPLAFMTGGKVWLAFYASACKLLVNINQLNAAGPIHFSATEVFPADSFL